MLRSCREEQELGRKRSRHSMLPEVGSSAQERHSGLITHCSPFPDFFLGSHDCKILEEQMNRARSKQHHDDVYKSTPAQLLLSHSVVSNSLQPHRL